MITNLTDNQLITNYSRTFICDWFISTKKEQTNCLLFLDYILFRENYFPKTSFTLAAILSRSSSVKLDPEGKHNPFSNNSSATFPP